MISRYWQQIWLLQEAFWTFAAANIRIPLPMEPTKSVQVSHNDDETLRLYGEPLTRQHSFSYLGVPFRTSGADWDDLINKNITAAHAAMRAMSSIGLNCKSFAAYRCVLLWKSFVRSCLDYGMAIANITVE